MNLSIYHAVVYSAVIYITGKSKVYLTAGDLPPAVCVWCKTVVVEVDGSVFHIPPAIFVGSNAGIRSVYFTFYVRIIPSVCSPTVIYRNA